MDLSSDSISRSGFIGVDGQVVAVPKRIHLALPYVQEALRNARGTRVKCLCGGGHLVVFDVPGFSGAVSDVRRESVDDPHKVGCFARELGFFMNRPVVYSTDAFDPPQEAKGNSPDSIAGAQRKVRHGSFTLFAHQLFGRASMRAFRSANSGKTYRDRTLRPFTVSELHTAIRQGLESATLSRGELLVAALASEHRQIIWGVTSAPLAKKLAEAAGVGRDVQLKLTGACMVGREAKSSCLVRIPLNVAARAGGRRIGYSEIIPPPYFFLITVDTRPVTESKNEVLVATRVVVFPVAGEGAPFAVESEFERAVVLKHHCEGFAFLKMGVHYELGELGTEFWRFGLLSTGRLPHRPDLVVFSKGVCWLVELAGLEDKPGYLELVGQRLAAMTRVTADADVKPFQISRKKFLKDQATAANSRES